MKISVIGSGAWGTALGVSLSATADVSVYVRNPDLLDDILSHGENRRYLPGVRFSGKVEFSSNLENVLSQADCVILAMPTAGLRSTLRDCLAASDNSCGYVLACKGFEHGSGKFPQDVFSEEYGLQIPVALLSGPSFAADLAAKKPVAVVLASTNKSFFDTLEGPLGRAGIRSYYSSDLIGVAVGGAVKNVIAIAAGMCEGLGFGSSASAALVTRGLNEMMGLGNALGGDARTLTGLSGLGDLALTCFGDLSRNKGVGLALARGSAIQEIEKNLGHVAEGVMATDEVCRLATTFSVEMPIASAVQSVLQGLATPSQAAESLLSRPSKSEV